MEKKAPELQKEVADNYDLVGVPVGKHHFNGFGWIDLSEVDLATAKALENAKFPHFKAKQKSAPAPKESAKGPDGGKDGAGTAAK